MKKLSIVFLLFTLFAAPTAVFASKNSASRGAGVSSSQRKIHVKSYTRKNGTRVKAYNRSAPKQKAIRIPKVKASKSSTARSISKPALRDSGKRIKRNEAARAAFLKMHPCPATGKRSGPCPGYVVDHVIPLSKGGPDAPSNMQWQTVAAAKAKDKWERKH